MKLTYVGRSDQRTLSSRDFPEVTFDFDEGVDYVEWVWVPGSILEVPEEVGEFLRLNHRNEFKVYEEAVPEPTREERKTELEAMSRDELIDLAAGKELIVATSKTKKVELVTLLLDYYHPIDDEAIDDESVDPDSEPESSEE